METIYEKLRAWADRLETIRLPIAVIVAEARKLADDAEAERRAELLGEIAERAPGVDNELPAAELPEGEGAAADLELADDSAAAENGDTHSRRKRR